MINTRSFFATDLFISDKASSTWIATGRIKTSDPIVLLGGLSAVQYFATSQARKEQVLQIHIESVEVSLQTLQISMGDYQVLMAA